ncbi:hypothetical protein [Dokdonella koreensis]|uniref:Lipoprotein n=1 Tax=Dokdonella koreensis DS-123 TaxID=1300342 RepID=A0A167G7R8_9GAMM|nr:hypothetical protein [Dokdonella koreensis]ANB16236.1 Hypothetical protein I596_197 [Dokdonella koreensis DS-123]
MTARTVVASALLGTLCFSGCATGFRGAPKLPFNPEQAYVAFESGKELERLAALGPTDTKEERNELVTRLISAVDLRYSEFKHDFVANRKHASSIADTLTLAMTVAGTLTTSAGVKDHYLAGIALVTGSQGIYDKNYLFAQTVSALIAQMDANRKEKLLEIVTAMSEDMASYPPISAFNDIIDYHHAGSVMGALIAIQRDARKKEEKSAKALQGR